VTQISFPVPLCTPSVKVNYLNRAQTLAGLPECPASEALGFPKASKGQLCVYTGLENSAGAALVVTEQGIFNAEGVSGKDSLNGASIRFEVNATAEENNFQRSGTWAVTAE
jgi:hypothetical protein